METSGKILKAARNQFDQGGLEGLSLREVAKRVGLTPMAIYRHYATKEALVDALVVDALDEWWACVAAIPQAAPLKWLRQIVAAHLEFALAKPRRYEAAFLVHSKHARRYPDDFDAGRSPAGTLQLTLITNLMTEGVLHADSAVEVMIAMAGLTQGLITLYRAGRIVGGESEFRALYLRATDRCLASFQVEKGK